MYFACTRTHAGCAARKLAKFRYSTSTQRSQYRLFFLRAPSVEEVEKFLTRQQQSAFSYADVGASATTVPRGYNLDRNRILLGRGENTWGAAVEAIRAWQMFNMPWIRLYWPSASIQAGINVAILVQHFGFYSLNAGRIVYVVDENGTVARYGFAYGTLAEHAESGEERFTVEWNRSQDEVWYDILAFSRPQKVLARVGYHLSRMLQKRFAEGSKAAMLRLASAK